MSKFVRWRAAIFLVALYAVCVAAPPAALALSGGVLSPHCISKNQAATVMQNHDHADHNLEGQNHLIADADGQIPADDTATKHSRSKICCGISCMSAIPADVDVIAMGKVIALKLSPSAQQVIVGSHPGFLNRPPIVH